MGVKLDPSIHRWVGEYTLTYIKKLDILNRVKIDDMTILVMDGEIPVIDARLRDYLTAGWVLMPRYSLGRNSIYSMSHDIVDIDHGQALVWFGPDMM